MNDRIFRYAAALITIASIGVAACDAPEGDRNRTDSTLVSVLADLHTESARARLTRPDWNPRDSVLRSHGLDSTAFLGMMRWYEENPEAYVALYSAVVDRISSEAIRAADDGRIADSSATDPGR